MYVVRQYGKTDYKIFVQKADAVRKMATMVLKNITACSEVSNKLTELLSELPTTGIVEFVKNYIKKSDSKNINSAMDITDEHMLVYIDANTIFMVYIVEYAKMLTLQSSRLEHKTIMFVNTEIAVQKMAEIILNFILPDDVNKQEQVELVYDMLNADIPNYMKNMVRYFGYEPSNISQERMEITLRDGNNVVVELKDTTELMKGNYND